MRAVWPSAWHRIVNDDEGKCRVLFGDGVEGARLPSGNHNVRAVYRKGLGLGGNVAAGKLTTLLTRPLGLSGADNPEAASGGEDAETLDKARENAPLTVLTLDRAVSVRDCLTTRAPSPASPRATRCGFRMARRAAFSSPSRERMALPSRRRATPTASCSIPCVATAICSCRCASRASTTSASACV